jgi:pectin methylesterase-like acyl-CoA thioesterase
VSIPSRASGISTDRTYVCEEAGAREYASIQAAINAAGPGDTIRVRSGVYDGPLTIPAGKDGLVLRGEQTGVAADSSTTRPNYAEETVLFGDATPTATGLHVASPTLHPKAGSRRSRGPPRRRS